MTNVDFYLLAAGIAYVYAVTRDLRNEIAALREQVAALQTAKKN